jgi:hypothetical protein
MTEHKLTPAQVRELRHAEGIIFQQHRGESTIVALTRGEPDTRVTIHAQGRLTDYRGTIHDIEDAECFHYEMNALVSDTMPTLMRRIKAGCTLTLHWVRDNNSPVIEEAGVHFDMMYLQIDKPGARREVYLVRATCSLDNTARMIRKGPGKLDIMAAMMENGF